MTRTAETRRPRPGAGRWLPISFVLAFTSLVIPYAHAQDAHESSLSEGEVDKLRESAISPTDRLTVFIGFLNDRMNRIAKLSGGPRKPGREEDLHELMEQCTAIFDDLTDNLDDYSKRHRDVRKVLPKVIAGTEGWGTSLKTPPEDQAYSVSRKLALESLGDVHETAVRLLEEQKTWFAAHPPSKDASRAAGQ